MHKNDAPPAKIRFKYEMAPEARLQTAHGVWGGINPQGEIEMNFYHESDCLPAYSERLITPDGSIGRVLLNYHTARAILEWLEDRVAALEEEGPPDMYDTDAGIEQ